MGRVLKNFIILLSALAVICSAMPMSASAMSVGAPAHRMADMNDMTMQMPCHQHKPAHNMPCDRQCCSCVLGAVALANNPVTVVSATMTRLQSAWAPQTRPENRTRKPALPPPIA
jgi:hypothetical protein